MSVLPTAKTPIERCEQKSLHTQTMLRKFKDVTKLDGLADTLEVSTNTVLARQAAHHAKVKALIVNRVEVKYMDWIADQAVRMGFKRAEIEDGKVGGRIATVLFPSGTTPIIKPVGGTQVKEMRALEGRYKEAAAIYPAALEEGKKIEALRARYEDALGARKQGMEDAAQARAARDLAKEEFLDVYSEVTNRIRAAFPRDKKTQDLFFLRDKTADSAEDDDGEEVAGAEEEGSSDG